MTIKQIPLITIDGPSGSGKGTIATLLAKQLGYNLLDSGAIYRVLAIAAEKHQIALDNEMALVTLATNLNVCFTTDLNTNKQLILLEGNDIFELVRMETTGAKASKVALLPKVREALLKRQRDFLTLPGLIADGRDMGTIIFPNAPLKFFLTASAKERARRRFNQLKSLGQSVILEDLINEIKDRDERDMNRLVAPLKPATDAIIIDSSELKIEQVLEIIMAEVSKHPIFKLN